jgi:hypothetical protein
MLGMNQQKKSPWIRWILLTFPIVLIGGCLAGVVVLRTTANSNLEAKLKELSAKGFSVDNDSAAAIHQQASSTKDQETWISVLDAFNTTAINQECKSLPVVGNGPEVPPLGQEWVEQVEVEEFLAKHADSLKQLVSISQDNGPVNLPIQFKSVATLLPYTQNMRTVARVLILEANLAARAKDSEREFRAINAMFGCSMALKGEPIIVSNLVSIAIAGMAQAQLQSAILGDRLGVDHLDKLQSRVVLTADPQAFPFALRGEAGLFVSTIRNLQGDSLESPLSSKAMAAVGIGDLAALRYLELIESASEVPTDNLQMFRDSMANIEQSFQANQSMLAAPATKMAAQILPAFGAASNAQIRIKMSSDLCILAMAIRRYEKSHGQLPDELSQLSELGIDLSKFKMVDGNLPKYQLTNDSPESALGSGRAVLWGLNPQPTSTNPQPSLSPVPPASPSESSEMIWVWGFK